MIIALSNSFFFHLHRWLRPSRPAVPGVFRARGVWGPCDCFRLGEPSVVQQVRHQSEGVSLWWKRRLHHSRGRGSRRPGNWRHHLHPDLHHHTPQWVSTVYITFTHWYLTSPTPTYIYCIQYMYMYTVQKVWAACDWLWFDFLSEKFISGRLHQTFTRL